MDFVTVARLAQAPGVGRAMLSLKALWEDLALPHLVFGGCLKFLVFLAYRCITPISASVFTACYFVYFGVQISLF